MSDEPARRRSTAEAITEVLAERVRALRESQGMSQEELAVALDKLGVPWKRATVVNLETRAPGSRGKGPGRDAVTLGEFLGLALALDVPPAMLLADPRHVTEVPLAKDLALPAWEVLLWLIGRTPHTLDSREALDTAAVIWLGWEIVEASAATSMTEKRWSGADDTALALADRRDRERHRESLLRIKQALEKLQSMGVPLPELHPSVLKRAEELDLQLFPKPTLFDPRP